MEKRILILFLTCLLVLYLSACSQIGFLKSKSDQLTVTGIHDTIVLNKTTKGKLIKQFGEPDNKIENPSKVADLYREDNGDSSEGGIMDRLDEETNFYQTIKSVKHDYDYSNGWDYDSCYVYRNKNLGIEYVRFYLKDGLVSEYYFGDITDKSVAKKDKYLRQIIE